MTPTGIFVTKGAKITIQLPENVDNSFSIFIGQWGIYQNLNNGQDLAPKEYVITHQSESLVSDLEGMLYVTNKSESNDYQVLIIAERAITVPTFIVGKTTNEQFANVLNNNQQSPFVEIISNYVFGTFQMQIARELWLNKDPNSYTIKETFIRLDKIYQLSNTVSGLNINYDGIAHKFNNKIQIATPDTGPGYAAASNYHLIFEKNTGASEALFNETSNKDWYLWHEIGHTYQNQNYKWDGLGEVTVNINALWIERELEFKNRLITDNIDKEIKKFIINSDQNKNFDKQSVWVKLGLFWQLDQAYGQWFFPTLNQTYRLLSDKLLPTSDFEKQQLFIEMTSKLVGQNLIPFFEKWGIKVNKNTKQIVSKYPNLTKKIWNNIIDGHYDKNAIIGQQLPTYQPVQGVKITGFVKKNIGDKILSNEIKQHIIMQDNLLINNVNSISYQEPYFLDSKSIAANFIVIDNNKTLIANKYQIEVKLNLENSILLEGIGYDWKQYRAIINLNQTRKTFFIGYNNKKIHDYFQNQSYIKITIKDDNNVIYKKVAVGQDTMAIFQDINNIKYKNNYQILFYFAEPKRGLYFEPVSNCWIPSTKNDVKFIIINNKLIKKE
ncbi:M60 family metallopeptidase [Spiroplasma endosymbiont of Polydrusus pterygomalis]|uniref:M60 family metallopeptidase n=1 Tax=Spiroplasma endosymbiont of Polydrusus pterygomalis TaxID=3139327 RepID=UPI003CCA9DB6